MIGADTIPGMAQVNKSTRQVQSCVVPLAGKALSGPGEVLIGKGYYWHPVDGSTPGGVVAGTEHGGAQTNGVCRIASGEGEDEWLVGKDWQGYCYFPKKGEERVSDKMKGYQVLAR
jgi:hypothetical protein